MQIRRSIPIALGISLALGVALVASSVTVAAGRPFTVTPLTGAAERPGRAIRTVPAARASG